MSSKEKRIIIKWKGVKKGSPAKNMDPNSEEFWNYFFSNYVKPRCDFDDVPLECKNINVSRALGATYGYRPSHIFPGETIIEVELQCPVCGTEYSGIGTDIELGEDGSVGIGSFRVHTTRMNIPPP